MANSDFHNQTTAPGDDFAARLTANDALLVKLRAELDAIQDKLQAAAVSSEAGGLPNVPQGMDHSKYLNDLMDQRDRCLDMIARIEGPQVLVSYGTTLQ